MKRSGVPKNYYRTQTATDIAQRGDNDNAIIQSKDILFLFISLLLRPPFSIFFLFSTWLSCICYCMEYIEDIIPLNTSNNNNNVNKKVTNVMLVLLFCHILIFMID